MRSSNLIESMFSIMNECANIYQLENGNIMVTYEFQEDNETMKRDFTSYEKAVNYLWKNGYSW